MRIVVAGAPPPTRTIERIETELGWEFIQIYGLTETSPLLTMNRGPAECDGLVRRARAQSVGRAGVPALGVRLQVSDRRRGAGPLQRGARRLLGAARGDRGRRSSDGWFHTGDGGTIDESDGYLTISDRKKDVIISGGENVSSIEVEDVIFSHPAVAEVAVIGVPHEKWGETVKALVVLRGRRDGDRGRDHRVLPERLARYKCPTSVEFREASRGRPPASCRSSSSASRTGPVSTAASTDVCRT